MASWGLTVQKGPWRATPRDRRMAVTGADRHNIDSPRNTYNPYVVRETSKVFSSAQYLPIADIPEYYYEPVFPFIQKPMGVTDRETPEQLMNGFNAAPAMSRNEMPPENMIHPRLMNAARRVEEKYQNVLGALGRISQMEQEVKQEEILLQHTYANLRQQTAEIKNEVKMESVQVKTEQVDDVAMENAFEKDLNLDLPQQQQPSPPASDFETQVMPKKGRGRPPKKRPAPYSKDLGSRARPHFKVENEDLQVKQEALYAVEQQVKEVETQIQSATARKSRAEASFKVSKKKFESAVKERKNLEKALLDIAEDKIQYVQTEPDERERMAKMFEHHTRVTNEQVRAQTLEYEAQIEAQRIAMDIQYQELESAKVALQFARASAEKAQEDLKAVREIVVSEEVLDQGYAPPMEILKQEVQLAEQAEIAQRIESGVAPKKKPPPEFDWDYLHHQKRRGSALENRVSKKVIREAQRGQKRKGTKLQNMIAKKANTAGGLSMLADLATYETPEASKLSVLADLAEIPGKRRTTNAKGLSMLADMASRQQPVSNNPLDMFADIASQQPRIENPLDLFADVAARQPSIVVRGNPYSGPI